MWDKILPDDLLIKVFNFNSPRPPTSDNFFGLVRRFEECCHVFHLATFTFIYCSDCFQEDCVAMYSVLLGDWMPGVPPGQLRQLGGKQLVSELNQGSATSILLFINPIVPVSRTQLGKKCLDTFVCKKTFKDYYLLSSFLQVLQGMFGKKCPTMYFDTDVCNYIVNYMYVKYIAMPIQLPIVESRSISRALLVQKCST